MPAAKRLPKHLSDLPPATPGDPGITVTPGTPGSSAKAAALPGVPGAIRRVEPIRSQAEYNAIENIDIAVGFAEALNMASLSRLGNVLAEQVRYVSDWAGVRFTGRDKTLRWFKPRLAQVCWSVVVPGTRRFHAQVVIPPDGLAAVLTETHPDKRTALTTFTIDNGLASHLFVTPRFDRRELRETGYFPPAA